MTFLESKIPPPVILLLSILIAGGLARIDQFLWLEFAYNDYLAIALMLTGFTIDVSGVLAFRRAETTINPLKPAKASDLVIKGVYRWSRNPMYFGMLLILLGVTVYLASLYALAACLFFVIYITRFQILPEERAMRELFEDQFDQYCQTTRRWI